MLKIESISKYYGSKPALREVSFELEPGIYGLLGPNGSGKSTLMNIMTGNLKASSGQVRWNGKHILELGRRYREILGYVPQQQALYQEFTVNRFLKYMASLKGISYKQVNDRVNEAAETVELQDKMRCKINTLSGGMKQRLLIAQAILDEPEILVMDEPTAGLDPKQRELIRNMISEISRGRTVLIATHVVSDIEAIANEILLLKEGQLIRKSGKDVLLKEIENDRTEIEGAQLTLEDVYLYHFGGRYVEDDIL